MNTLSIDLGGTTIKMALVCDNVVARVKRLPAESGAGLRNRLPAVADAAHELVQGSACVGVGIAFPGIVDSIKQRVLAASGKYEDAPALDLPAWCAAEFGLPLALENDANAALIGEVACGAGRGYGDAVMMILGTGVGTAAMIGGRLVRGRRFQAGCLGGHMVVRPRGRACTCGGWGCLESEASTWALPIVAREHPLYAASMLRDAEPLDFRALAQAWRAGDALAQALFDHCVAHWATGIINLIHAYDPEIVILSGGVLRFHEIVPALRELVEHRGWKTGSPVDMRVAAEPENSVLLGLHQQTKEMVKQ